MREMQRIEIRKEEAALITGRSLRSLERAMANREIKYYKIGKSVRFTQEAIREYQERLLVKAKA
jgi:excisionase family DNA binding protein